MAAATPSTALACDDPLLWGFEPVWDNSDGNDSKTKNNCRIGGGSISSHTKRRDNRVLHVGEQGRTALHLAVSSGNESMARLLLERGADPSRQDNLGATPLHLAAEAGLGELVRILMEKLADPNEADFLGRSALFRAVESENEEVVRQLLEASADVNMKDSMGNTALHLAVENRSESMALILLEYGANVDD